MGIKRIAPRARRAWTACLLACLLAVSLAAPSALAAPAGPARTTVQQVSGVVNTSALETGASVVLTGNTTIQIDANKTIASLTGYDYDLAIRTVSTDKTFTIGNGNWEQGIAVQNLALEDGRVVVNGYCYASNVINIFDGVHSFHNEVYGLEADRIYIAGGAIDAYGDEIGVITHDDFTFSGGVLNASGSSHPDAYSTGIYCMGRAYFSGGTVYAFGRDTGINTDVQLRISGGDVHATGAAPTGFGVYVGREILYPITGVLCTGGSLEAKGGISGIRSARKIAIVHPATLVSPLTSQVKLTGAFSWEIVGKDGMRCKDVEIQSYQIHFCSAAQFDDVDPSLWYHNGIDYMVDHSYMRGVTNTLPPYFAPDDPATRAMIVTILHRMEGVPSSAYRYFSDVPSGQWYTNAVSWAAQKGIVLGYDDGSFRPDAPITREQLATFFYRYAAYKGGDMTPHANISGFADGASVSLYAQNAMAWAVGKGLIHGVGNNRLDPQGPATRAQVAVIFDRYVNPGVG